jgi:hypothetical protein
VTRDKDRELGKPAGHGWSGVYLGEECNREKGSKEQEQEQEATVGQQKINKGSQVKPRDFDPSRSVFCRACGIHMCTT